MKFNIKTKVTVYWSVYYKVLYERRDKIMKFENIETP